MVISTLPSYRIGIFYCAVNIEYDYDNLLNSRYIWSFSSKADGEKNSIFHGLVKYFTLL